MKHQIIYLACPYTHKSPSVMELRWMLANNAAARLIEAGHVVYSPISMTHPINKKLAGTAHTLGSDFWVDFDEVFMEVCSSICVLLLDGWKESKGVHREIEYFKKRNLLVFYMNIDGMILAPGVDPK